MAMGADDGVLTLSDTWRAWVVDNTLDGVSPDALVETLVAAAIPQDVAAREVEAIVQSPALGAARQYRRRVLRLEQLLELTRKTAQQCAHPDAIDRVARIDDADAFFRRYYAGNRPLLVMEAAADWPALRRWTFEGLRERFGDVTVQVEVGRCANWKHEGRYETQTLGVFIDTLRLRPGNERYCIAHNNAIRRPALRPLLDDIVVDPIVFDPDPAKITYGSSLWIGGTTTTPLHHDTTNILFHQIVGRKRWVLVPPSETELLDGLDTYYHRPGLEALSDDVRRFEVVLEPGQALFVPVGWYHRVEALEPSVSFSLMNFRRANDFSWFGPGKVR